MKQVRNKYSKEFEDDVRNMSSKLTQKELIEYLNKKYNLNLTKTLFVKYLYKHKIRCIDYNYSKVRNMKKVPIGYEYTKPDGMILVKVQKPDVWDYKQRVIYEKYYNVKLTNDDYIIFKNQNRNDFSIDNLMKITRHESAILSNKQMFSKNPEVTKLGVLVSKLMIKTKNIENNNI